MGHAANFVFYRTVVTVLRMLAGIFVVTVAKRRLFHMVRSMHHAQSFSIYFLRRILCIQSPVLLPIDTQIEVIVL